MAYAAPAKASWIVARCAPVAVSGPADRLELAGAGRPQGAGARRPRGRRPGRPAARDFIRGSPYGTNVEQICGDLPDLEPEDVAERLSLRGGRSSRPGPAPLVGMRLLLDENLPISWAVVGNERWVGCRSRPGTRAEGRPRYGRPCQSGPRWAGPVSADTDFGTLLAASGASGPSVVLLRIGSSVVRPKRGRSAAQIPPENLPPPHQRSPRSAFRRAPKTDHGENRITMLNGSLGAPPNSGCRPPKDSGDAVSPSKLCARRDSNPQPAG